jgi:hypothetical protein
MIDLNRVVEEWRASLDDLAARNVDKIDSGILARLLSEYPNLSITMRSGCINNEHIMLVDIRSQSPNVSGHDTGLIIGTGVNIQSAVLSANNHLEGKIVARLTTEKARQAVRQLAVDVGAVVGVVESDIKPTSKFFGKRNK